MMLFADAVARHLHHLAVVGKSDNTINHATYKFARFEAIMGENRTLDEFKTPQDVMAYLNALHEKQLSAVTINNYLSALRGLYDWAIAEHLVTHNPFRRLNVKVKTALPSEVQSLKDVARAIAAIDVPLYRMFLAFQLHTGMRINEVRTLTLDCLDMKRRRVYIVEAKGGKSRTVPLNDTIYARMREYLDEERRPSPSPYVFASKTGAPICKTTINRHLKQAAYEVLDTPLTSHALRHAFTTDLYDKGVMETTLSELLGHAEPKTTRRYIRVRHNHLHDAVNRLGLD